MNSRFFYIASVFVSVLPSICFAETESGYKVIGFLVSLPSFAFFSAMVWLMIKNGDERSVSTVILGFLLLSLIPLGVNFTDYGAVYPNWIAFFYGFDFQVFPDLVAAFFIIVVFFLQDFFRHK